MRDNIRVKLMQIMQELRLGKFSKIILLAVAAVICTAGTALATTSLSPNYQATQMEFNAGSTLESCSGQYCARTSIGDLGVGESTSSVSTAKFGQITASDPLLEVIVEKGTSNLGDLSTEETATKTMVVRVRTHLSDGYILQLVGTPPKYGSHALNTPSSPTASSPGTEQFGINAVANTAPNVGAAPVQVPSSQTSFGEVSEAYRTPNMFKYASEDIVARSMSESGQTDYTISIIVNIANSTPAGHYAGDFSAIVTPVY